MAKYSTVSGQEARELYDLGASVEFGLMGATGEVAWLPANLIHVFKDGWGIGWAKFRVEVE